jgi:hypothetical protein
MKTNTKHMHIKHVLLCTIQEKIEYGSTNPLDYGLTRLPVPRLRVGSKVRVRQGTGGRAPVVSDRRHLLE